MFNNGNKWAAYALWDAYHHGKNGVAPDSVKADKWLREFVKDAWLVKFEPVGAFKPTTPSAFLAKMSQAHTFSGKNDLGLGSFFRTTKQGDKLIGSFLVSRPDDFKAAVADVSEIKVVSVEPMTPEGFVTYEASPQESFAPAPSGEPPKVIATSPAVGATDVDPSVTEITVTFDQDMDTGGMSWTGGPPDFPSAPADAQAVWRDKRTCVLPVTLQAAHYYRVGINSKSYRSFASENGVSAMPSAIYFTTKGASAALQARVATPRLVVIKPVNGAQDVDPNLSEIRATFNVRMGGGFSWCTAGDDDSDFPKGPADKHPYWTEEGKTCVLPVSLKPGMTYRLVLNAPGFNNFQSAAGVPLEPVSYSFKTADRSQ